MASGGSVVNLLDLREEAEDNDAAKTNRWARRNPKAQAKAGGRQRRRHRDGDTAARRTSGMSGNSDLSGDEDAGGRQSAHSDSGEAIPPREQSVHASWEAQQLQQQQIAQDGRKPLVQNDPEAQTGMQALEIETTDSTGDEGGFKDARQIAQLRAALQNTDADVKGPHFKQNVWEFYMVKAGWSDPLCVALNHSNMYLPCIAPCCWPWRLCQTLRRASPVSAKCCCSCPVGGCCSFLVVSFVFLLPIAFACTFLPQVSAILVEQCASLPVCMDQEDKAAAVLLASIVLTCLSTVWSLWAWARMLHGVGVKYSVKEAVNKPISFMCKAMCCICATNMRVATHVDRAQGYLKVQKHDRTLIELSDQMATLQPPSQSVMV